MSERDLFIAALHLRDAARAAFLDQACGGDGALRDARYAQPYGGLLQEAETLIEGKARP